MRKHDLVERPSSVASCERCGFTGEASKFRLCFIETVAGADGSLKQKRNFNGQHTCPRCGNNVAPEKATVYVEGGRSVEE